MDSSPPGGTYFNQRIDEIRVNLFGGGRLIVNPVEGERLGRIVGILRTRYGALQRRRIDVDDVLSQNSLNFSK